MNTEMQNIAIAEALLKFVIEKLNNPPQNQDNEYLNLQTKQQSLILYLYKYITHHISLLKNKSHFSPLKARTVKKLANQTDERINQLINTLNDNHFKQSLITNNLPKELTANIPSFLIKNDKAKINTSLNPVINYAISPLFTPWQNQKWFELITKLIEKHPSLNQNDSFKVKLKKVIDINEINILVKSQYKVEQKLNELSDYINQINTTEEHYQAAADEIDKYINIILHEQLTKEILSICNTENTDKLTKLNLLYAKIYKENKTGNYTINNELFRKKMFEVIEPYILKLEESILSDFEKMTTAPLHQQLLEINSLSSKIPCSSAVFKERLVKYHEQVCQQIVSQIEQIKKCGQMNIFQKIDAIHQLLGEDPDALSSKITSAMRELKLELRKSIRQDIEKIFNDNSLNTAHKLKQIKVVIKMMGEGSAIQQSYINIANGYLKLLVNKTIQELTIPAETQHFQALDTLNALAISAQQLNVLDAQNVAIFKKYYTQHLWKTALAIDYLCRQNFIAESAFDLPSEIKKFKLAANAFNISQQGIDAITKTFIAYLLSSETINESCLKIEQLIVIANHLLQKGSLDGFMAVMTALNNGAISRLKNAFDGLSTEAKQLFVDFNIIVDANNNFPTLRKVQNAGIESDINVVPSVILLSKDLTSAAEKPEQSQKVIISLTNQFNSARTKITSQLKPLTVASFHTYDGIDDQTAYQRSIKLEPKNGPGHKATIFQQLNTLTIPVKPKIFHTKLKKILSSPQQSQNTNSKSNLALENKPTKSSSTLNNVTPNNRTPITVNNPSFQSKQNFTTAHTDTTKGKERSTSGINRANQNLFDSASKILRSSSASYIAQFMAFATDEIKTTPVNNCPSEQNATNQSKHPTIPLLPMTNTTKQDTNNVTKKGKTSTTTFNSVMKKINDVWEGVLQFFSFDINSNMAQPVSSYKTVNSSPASKKVNNNFTLPDYNPTTRYRNKPTQSVKQTGSYTLRLFPINNGSRICQPIDQSIKSHSAIHTRKLSSR